MRVVVVQMNSGRDVEDNLEQATRLAQKAGAERPDWILFPENAPFLGRDGEKTEHAEPLGGRMTQHFADLAVETDAWVTLGSFPEAIDGGDAGTERTYNTQVLFDPTGDRRAVYRKIHLFDVDVEGGRSYRESDHVKPGDDLVLADVTASDGETWRAGLTVCYDLRFPELYRGLQSADADILTVPSAFTKQTGRDHWDPLLRTRAIENQCYVLAPNQWGHHFGSRSSYGHSAIYDPWGERIATCSDKVGIAAATLDHGHLSEIRNNMPVRAHRTM
jgi:predicted amidohydrolase